MNENFKKYFLSLGNIGSSKFAPGTFGSFFAFIVILILKNLYSDIPILIFFPVLFLFLALIYFLSYIFIGSVVGGDKYDQSWIVADEFIGMMIAGLPYLYFRPFDSWLLISGFLLFRVLDIFKPHIIGKIDKINSPHGVLLDDVIAGAVAGIIIAIFIISFHFLPEINFKFFAF